MALRFVTMMDSDIALLHAHSMKRDFPDSELKSLKEIRRLCSEGAYDVLGAYDGGLFLGYALIYRPSDLNVALLDYLAVEPDLRSRGVGTAMLEELTKRYAPSKDYLLIECERPECAQDEALAKRRILFYLHAGASITGVRVTLFGVEFSILTLNCGEKKSDCDPAKMMQALYRTMLTPNTYEKNVRIVR